MHAHYEGVRTKKVKAEAGWLLRSASDHGSSQGTTIHVRSRCTGRRFATYDLRFGSNRREAVWVDRSGCCCAGSLQTILRSRLCRVLDNQVRLTCKESRGESLVMELLWLRATQPHGALTKKRRNTGIWALRHLIGTVRRGLSGGC